MTIFARRSRDWTSRQAIADTRGPVHRRKIVLAPTIDRQYQTQIARALVNAFLALALIEPTLLLIEDLQWIDPESRHFLKLLARANTPQPLCILLTGRPESSNQATEIADSLIHLQPLSRIDMEALGRQLWPKDSIPAVLARAIDRADGFPSYWRSFCVRRTRRTRRANIPCRRASSSVIHARLQRLSPKMKTFAQTLSLLGEEVKSNWLRRCSAWTSASC